MSRKNNIGKTRIRLARLLEAALREKYDDQTFRVNPEFLCRNMESCPKTDMGKWSGFVEYQVDGRWLSVSIASWSTMGDIVKSGTIQFVGPINRISIEIA